MNNFTVLYRINAIMDDGSAPFGFCCWARDSDHAEDQCLNTFPGCDVVWIAKTRHYRDALADYWGEYEAE